MGLPPTFSIGLGSSLVSSPSLLPSPPAIKTTSFSNLAWRFDRPGSAKSKTTPFWSMTGMWRSSCCRIMASIALGRILGSTIVGLRVMTSSARTSKVAPRSKARRTSPSVIRPRSLRFLSTTRATCNSLWSIVLSTSRSKSSLLTRVRRQSLTFAYLFVRS